MSKQFCLHAEHLEYDTHETVFIYIYIYIYIHIYIYILKSKILHLDDWTQFVFIGQPSLLAHLFT